MPIFQSYYVVKEAKIYPWPCESDSARQIKIFPCDILTGRDGVFTKHSGVACTNIHIPDEDVVLVNEPIELGVS